MKQFDANSDSMLDATELNAALKSKALPTSNDLASQLMQTLFLAGNAPKTVASEPDSVDAIWKRAQMLSLGQGNGPGNAMLQSLIDRDSDDEKDSSWYW